MEKMDGVVKDPVSCIVGFYEFVIGGGHGRKFI